jgi:hypothetical protein
VAFSIDHEPAIFHFQPAYFRALFFTSAFRTASLQRVNPIGFFGWLGSFSRIGNKQTEQSLSRWLPRFKILQVSRARGTEETAVDGRREVDFTQC